MNIDFGFLRECIAALRNAAPEHGLRMSGWMAEYPSESNGWCGTPQCVIGHWALQKVMKRPADFRRLEYLGEYISEATRIVNDRVHGGQTAHGLNELQVAELFGTYGCNCASSKEEAIRYIEYFILLRGGSLEEPKPLIVAVAPDWKELSQQPAAAVEVIRDLA